MVHAGDESVLAIGRWCEEQDVDAWFTHGGYLQASTAPPFDHAWDAVAEACAELGEEGRIEILDGAATRAVRDSTRMVARAYLDPNAVKR